MKYKRKPDGIYRSSSGRLMEHRGYVTRIYWSGQMLSDLRRHFPSTLNEEMASMLGVSVRTMLRKARELGLEKDPKWLSDNWAERRRMGIAKNRKNGWPGSFRKGRPATGGEFKPGHKMSEESKRKQVASLRRWVLLNPGALKARGEKIRRWAANNPEAMKARGQKVLSTMRQDPEALKRRSAKTWATRRKLYGPTGSRKRNTNP